MAITYPGTLDVFTNPLGTQTLDSPDHAGQHSDANDALEALEAKVGVGAGTPTANKLLVGSGNGTAVWSTTWSSGTINAATIGTPAVTGGTFTSQTLAGTPVLDATSAVPFYGDSMARQAIINGNFDISQRATTFVAGANNDDVYTLDHWNLISDGNDAVDVSQEAVTDLSGSNYAIKLDTETAKRYGIVQFLEAKDAQKFKGKTVSISFAVKSDNISAVRATVLSWASTADAVTSDVVASWGATPTWATNWADNATPADLTVTSSWTTVKVENIAIDESTVNNLALVIWTPNEETIGDIIYISQVQMNMGGIILPFQPKSFEEELRACQRYYEKSYDIGTVPGSADGFNQMTCIFIAYTAGGGVDVGGTASYKVQKRNTPTVTTYAADSATGSGTAARVRDMAVGGLETITAVNPATTNSTTGFNILTCSTGLTAGRAYGFNWTAESEL